MFKYSLVLNVFYIFESSQETDSRIYKG